MDRTRPEGATTPVRTDAQRLIAGKRAALAEAEHRLTEAREAYDEAGVVASQARIRALKEIIADLEVRHAASLEEVARDRARRWIGAKALDDVAREIEQAQAKALAAVEAAVAAVAAEGQARRRWAGARGGVEILLARWPELASEVPAASARPVGSLDYTGRIAAAAGDVRDTITRPLITIGAPASATAEQRRRLVLRRLFEILDRKRGSVPVDVREIVAMAPRPNELDETDDERARRERRAGKTAAAGAEMSRAVADYERALGSVPGGRGLGGI